MVKIISRDPISDLCVLLAAAISIYFFTFSKGLIVLFPDILLVTAIALQIYLNKKKGNEEFEFEGDLTHKTLYNKTYYSIIGIAGMLATSLFVSYVSFKGLGLSMTDAAMYGVLAALAEEMFFRGVIFDYLIQALKYPTIAMFGSALIFMIYHFAVYGGNNSALLYVFIGGFILSFVTFKSGSLTAAFLAHSVNNILSALGLLVVPSAAISFILPHLHWFVGGL